MFPATLRLTKKDFETTNHKVVYRGEFFDIAQSKKTPYKIACVISKKTIKKAVARNKTRRRILHICASLFLQKAPKYTTVIYPKKTTEKAQRVELLEELAQAFATLN